MTATTPATPVYMHQIVLDCNDLDRTAKFWADLLTLFGTPVTPEISDDWAGLGPMYPGGPELGLQPVPEGKAGKNRLHLEFQVPDLALWSERVLTVGARPAGPGLPGGETFRVFTDPEGNEFCLCAG